LLSWRRHDPCLDHRSKVIANRPDRPAYCCFAGLFGAPRNDDSPNASYGLGPEREIETMATSEDGPGTRPWRSQAFAQPLILTVAGALAPLAVLLALSALASSEAEACTGLSCGWINYSGIMQGLLIYAVWLLITGFVVGRSSPDSGLASRAILLAVAILSLTAIIGALVSDSQTKDFIYIRDLVLGVVALALALFVPIRLGFAVGRRVKDSGTPR
jgi:hypothetical protein